ncbi:HNH endonuclease [Curtobacterium sp. MCBD17_040]|uniref:HNH endonuclease n=1 Tax=Curtobacterium sp. MCBD17_040 TaxID=2175674 RepID=UPI000DA83E06|nr:HNH endonuclease [Curtobacterium sp. MCBD17_040]WIB65383.1 HNH endonuclease [Curtobacterium sp. MCBD17_040]
MRTDRPLLSVPCASCGQVIRTHVKTRVYCSTRCRWLLEFAKFELGGCPCGARVDRSAYRPFGPDDVIRLNAAYAELVTLHRSCRGQAAREEDPNYSLDCDCNSCRAERGQGERERRRRTVPKAKRRAGLARARRAAVLKRDGYICQICFLPTDPQARFIDDLHPEVDHRSQVQDGGDDDIDNLRTAHRWCNEARNSGATDAEIRERAVLMFSAAHGADGAT